MCLVRDQSWMNVNLLDGCSEGERLHLAIISEHALALQLQQEIMVSFTFHFSAALYVILIQIYKILSAVRA